MAQKTNLNINPYFDDFSEKNVGARDKNYYKVLFNPGRAIQARELNTLQSILQDQVESFGSHIFKDGSMVIPGNIAYDGQFYAVKLNQLQYGVDISNYIEKYVGKKIIGTDSGITANVQLVELPNSEVEYVTLYVKYTSSDSNFEVSYFKDNESLYIEEDITYQSTTITAGTPFATTIVSDATAIGSAASIGEGVYFIRGTFVRVPKQTIILDYYTNTPSYRIGLRINEEIVTARDDSSLYDNAKGFTNYAAPGADRFKISLTLTKRLLTDTNDVDFVELLRVQNGAIKKIETKSTYSNIRDYLAQRTYDESGDYVVTPFQFSLNNSLNNRIGNDGLFFDTEKTEQGNTPSNDLMCFKMSPGKAYVKGYDIEKTGVEILDVDKPRTTQSVPSVNIPFEMGNLIRINNVTGSPNQKGTVFFQGRRKDSTTVATGSTIGSARIYTINVTDAAHTNQTTNWDLYLYDVQTFTEITLNQALTSLELPTSSFIKGKSSGATGYVSSFNGAVVVLSQTSGTFSVNEQILINGTDSLSRTISSFKVYTIEDIKSIHQPTSISGFSTAFTADSLLIRNTRPEVITISAASGGISTATVSSPYSFTGIKTDNIIRYQRAGLSTETYNRVASISSSGLSITLAGITTVNGVCDGALPTAQYSGSYSLGDAKILNDSKGFLYAQLPDSNIASTNLSTSTITFTAQSSGTLTPSAGSLTVNTGNFNLGINTTSASFAAFDEERYSIFYADGSIESLTSDKVTLNASSTQVTFTNISNKAIAVINATFVKNGIQNKIKQFTRSKTLNVTRSRNTQSGVGINTSVNDGLTFNQFYGLRVQDEEISLNNPDVVRVIAVYESLDTNPPVLTTFSFSSVVNVDNNAIIGENIIGKAGNAVARVVAKPSANTLSIVYLNSNTIAEGEEVLFQESNIKTTVASVTVGSYKDITRKYTLDKGQKEQYYDYSKLIRNSGESAPTRQLLIIFDHYTVSTSDTGDVFTVNSYDGERFTSDIPSIGKNNVRASDTLDFRPRVTQFTSTSASPFDFASRSFGTDPKILMSPNESAVIGYQFYLGRIDKLFIDKNGKFNVVQGTPALTPKEPAKPSDSIEIATINLPPYLYNPKDAVITLVDNKRYTMRDIGKIENRVVNLERVTSLSLLELNTQTLQIRDAQGLSRFKTGFFVDDFKNTNLIDLELSRIDVNTDDNELTTQISRNTINLKPVPAENITDETLDLSQNFTLFDSNIQKSDEILTLKYDSVGWIEQLFATKVENVNPFNIVSYSGTIKLSPASDSWVRTIRLPDVNVNQTNWVWLYATGHYSVVGQSTSTTTVDKVVATGNELYMRSRNTGFKAVNLRPLTRYYQFLDGNGSVDYIPKLVEIATDTTLQNYGASTAFQVGEKVLGYINSTSGSLTKAISFRVANSNHKEGPYNNPTVTYTTNPYSTTENIPTSYSASSKILNIDIESLCAEAQGLYSGYLTTGMKLVGQSSGAVTYVKDLRLISDINGFLSGSFFLKDPNASPVPAVRIATGSKVYKLSSSQTNEAPLPGSNLISSGETIYKSEGTWQQKQRTITTTTTIYYVDPLAQSFSVGASTDNSNGNTPNEDINGAFLSAVDLYFAHKDPGNAPLTVEVRTVELGTPTTKIIGNPVTLRPSDIQTSNNASVATKVTFDYPIYLAPGLEYAIVLLAPQSDQYEVWIAEMGQKTIETSTLPDSQSIRYSRQFALGSLFKSQNGSIWTANQYQDLKFKLYKSKFTSSTGSAFFHNPTLDESNGYVQKLDSNSITLVPRQVKIGITTTTSATNIGILTTGRKVTSASTPNSYGYIVGTGSSVATIGVTTGGTNYANGTVSTYAITGNGTGLTLSLTTSSGNITSASIVSPGNGYAIGDVVGIVTSSVSTASGRGARITVNSITGLDTLYLSNVQGNSFVTAGISTLVFFDNSGNATSIGGTNVLSSTPIGGITNGNFLKVNHFNHGMYANNNKVVISNVISDIIPTTLSQPVTSTNTTISVASTSNFNTFEGVVVSGTNPGFIKIENEIIKYTSVGSGTLNGITRGIDSTLQLTYQTNTQVYKYELGGVSLRRVNKTHDISDIGIDIDSYYLEIDRSAFDSNVTNRSTDGSITGAPQLSFNSNSICGGTEIRASENIQFNSIIPQISVVNPSPATSAVAQIRTVTGTSVNGTESSFVDNGYEPVEIGVENKLTSTRIVCSNINEQTYLSSLLRNKSFTVKVDLSTTDQNISPVIFWKESKAQFMSNRLNSPISDYTLDNRVNNIIDDPHAAVYVSNKVSLKQPATSLKVILSAYRDSTADFRVLYSLVRPDSSEVSQAFELFPGYDNLTVDNNQDGYLDIIDPSKNSGLPDVFVPASLKDQFLEYEFSANNLGSFTGYTIKIVMSGKSQAYTPRFKDLRSIALA